MSRVLIPWLLTLLCCVLCPGLVCDHQLLLLLIAVLLVPLALVLIVVQTFLPLRLPRAVGPAVVPVPVLVILILWLCVVGVIPVRLEILTSIVPLPIPL